jgi:hypothetical protein
MTASKQQNPRLPRASNRVLVFATATIACAVSTVPALAQSYYEVQVVDAATGRGVPLVELSPQGGTTVITDSNGIAAFNQPGLMNQSVPFNLRSYGYSSASQTLLPTLGGSTTLTINRQNRAERLYRVSGEGIYQDSVLVGASVPIAEPLINARVTGHDSVQTAIYQGKIHWIWGDTLFDDDGFNFRSSGATSLLPDQGGLNPSLGVNLNYFETPQGYAQQMMPVNETGLVWLDGLFAARDVDGNERMLARYERHLDLATVAETGLALFNDSTKTFQRFQTYSLTNPVVPQGHVFHQQVNGQDHIYFSQAYVNVRVKADWASIIDNSKWEVFTPLKSGSVYNPNNPAPALDLDQNGNLIFGWKKNTTPLDYDMLENLVHRSLVERNELPFRLQDHVTGEAVRLHRSSIEWNEFRNAWIMVGTEAWGDSFLGEVWFSEAPAPEGPWVNAVKVATHDRAGSAGDYTFYNPMLHPYFDQEGGRFIYFEGTYSNTFSGNSNPTPLYDYNQMMYRLDLAAIPDLFPRLPGDFDRNGVVDSSDYIIWRNSVGQTGFGLAADGNLDNKIDSSDYNLWRGHFGGMSAGAGATDAPSIPEPPMAALLLTMASFVSLGRSYLYSFNKTAWRRRGQAQFAPKTPQIEPVPDGFVRA